MILDLSSYEKFDAFSNALIISFSSYGLKSTEGLQISFNDFIFEINTFDPDLIASIIGRPKLSIKDGKIRY